MRRINVKAIFIILITFSLAFSATFIFFSVHNVKEEKVNINKKSAIATIINDMSQLNISEAKMLMLSATLLRKVLQLIMF